MRFSDGVVDVVGNCNRSVTQNSRAFKIMIYSKLSFGFFATVEPILGVLGLII
jgi:hypothetical protein